MSIFIEKKGERHQFEVLRLVRAAIQQTHTLKRGNLWGLMKEFMAHGVEFEAF